MTVLLVFAGLFLAFSNGANDNFKGFATVWGAQALSYRSALLLATLATFAGSLFSLVLAEELVQRFSGSGLVPNNIAAAPGFLLAVAIGAATTVLVATRTGFPVSTTHALLGGLIGAGLAENGGAIDLRELGGKFLLPLLLSPIMAAALGLLAYQVLRSRRGKADCVCLVEPMSPSPVAPSGEAWVRLTASPHLVIAPEGDCDRIAPPLARLSPSRLRDRIHILSASSICFARAVNDTPKLAALLLGAHLLEAQFSAGLVAAAMAVGGLLLARRVAETMSFRLNHIDASQGVSANLITAGLVLAASKFGLPVSTTHVSVGSIAGVGTGAGTMNWTILKNILLSWLATLPVAATLAWIAAAIAV